MKVFPVLLVLFIHHTKVKMNTLNRQNSESWPSHSCVFWWLLSRFSPPCYYIYFSKSFSLDFVKWLSGFVHRAPRALGRSETDVGQDGLRHSTLVHSNSILYGMRSGSCAFFHSSFGKTCLHWPCFVHMGGVIL